MCCVSTGESQISGLRLCTDSYTLQEVIILMNVLKINFDLNCRIHWKKNNKGEKLARIYIPSS
jgi:hypothetical protein